MELERPDYLSIVKRPANRSPFAIVRSSDGKKKARTYDTPLLTITLPAGTSEEDAQSHFTSFGLKEDEYEIVVSDSAVMFRRIALDEALLGDSSTIMISDGITAQISRSEMQEDVPPDVPSIGLVKLTFSAEKFATRADCENYLRDCEIVFNEEDLFSIGKEFLYVRHDCDAETKDFGVQEGVVGTFAQTKRNDVPAVIYRSVVEEAYGRYGWGHVDFFQALSDNYFSQDAREAVNFLWDVLDNILFYSYLPLSDRQALVDNALQEFSVYLRAMMSALPRATDGNASPDGALNNQSADVRSDLEGETEQENPTIVDDDTRNEDMTGKTDAAPKGTVGDTPAMNDDAPQYITRAEAEKLAKDTADQTAAAVVAALRADPAPAPDLDAVDEPALAEVLRGISARLEKLDETVGKLKESAEETVSRADDDEGEHDDENEQRIQREIQERDPMRGSIFRGDAARVISARDPARR